MERGAARRSLLAQTFVFGELATVGHVALQRSPMAGGTDLATTHTLGKLAIPMSSAP